MIVNSLIYNLLDNLYLSPFYSKNQTKNTSSFPLIRMVKSKNHSTQTIYSYENLIYLPTRKKSIGIEIRRLVSRFWLLGHFFTSTLNGQLYTACILPASPAFDSFQAAEGGLSVAFDSIQAATRWLSVVETTVSSYLFQFLSCSPPVLLLCLSLSSPYPLPILSLSSPYPLPILSL